MKRILPFLFLVLVLVLNACTPLSPTLSSVEVLQTSIALTQTAAPTKTAGPLESIASPTGLPSPTPTGSTSGTPGGTATATAASPTVTGVPSTAAAAWSPAYADQFIRYYFQHINARDYTTTWSLLTNNFIASNNSPAQGGYSGYVNYWNTVQRVDIQNVAVTSLSGYYATVMVDMVFNYTNGVVASAHQPFDLYFDTTRNTWMFNTVTSPAPPPPLTISMTPAQFIYFYFGNINMRNYGLTWSLLTDRFISHNNSPDQGGYAGYVAYWDSISSVNVYSVNVLSQSSNYAVVSVGQTFNYFYGNVVSVNVIYDLLYNYYLGTWQFHSP